MELNPLQMVLLYQEPFRRLVQFWAAQAPPEPDKLDQIKQFVEVTASVLTLIAIIVGGFWTYWLFVRTRQKYPSANLTQRIDYRIIAESKLWLRVTVTLQNASKVLLSLVHAKTWVQQVIPVDEDILAKILQDVEPLDDDGLEYLWPLAVEKKEKDWPKGSRQIEPGESDQVHFDFILSPDVETVIVYSYFRNAKKFNRKNELGWQITSVYDLNDLRNGGELNGARKRGTIATDTDTITDTTIHRRHKTSASETGASRQEVKARTRLQQAPINGENDEPQTSKAKVATEESSKGGKYNGPG